MPQIDKLNILSENDFWEGLSVYRYDYIPEDLKEVLMRKIKDKGVNQNFLVTGLNTSIRFASNAVS